MKSYYGAVDFILLYESLSVSLEKIFLLTNKTLINTFCLYIISRVSYKLFITFLYTA